MPTESKKCQYCGSNKAGIATNEERTKYLRWNRNPYEKGACSESKNGMSNNLVDDSKEKRCELFGSNRTYIVLTMDGRPYPKWNKNPSKKIVGYVEDVTTRLCNVKSVKRE